MIQVRPASTRGPAVTLMEMCVLILNYRLLCALGLSVALASALPVMAQTAAPDAAPAAEGPHDPAPEIPATVLKDPKMIAAGEEIWKEQCTHCHGSKAYPGKAPKLQPARYKPDFVWDRVHNGFRGMPPWKDVYSPEQVLGVVAYVLSDDFFP